MEGLIDAVVDIMGAVGELLANLTGMSSALNDTLGGFGSVYQLFLLALEEPLGIILASLNGVLAGVGDILTALF